MQSCISMFTEGTSLCNWRGSTSGGARVKVGPNTSARLADVILLSALYRDTLQRGSETTVSFQNIGGGRGRKGRGT